MSEKERTFRLHVRFSTVEYAELNEDLANFSGADKAARIRMLMRIGLQTLKGQVHGLAAGGMHPHLAPVVDMQRAHKSPADGDVPQGGAKAEAPVPVVSEPTDEHYDKLLAQGMDPALFKMGGR